MSLNTFIANPIRVVVYDPVANKNKRTFVFLGDVPRDVVTACRGQQKADKILKEFYGAQWARKLCIGLNQDHLVPPKIVTGGIENNAILAGLGTRISSDALEEAASMYDKTIVPVSRLVWILEKIETRDTSSEVIATTDNDAGLVPLTGLGRIAEAVENGTLEIPVIIVPRSALTVKFGADDEDDILELLEEKKPIERAVHEVERLNFEEGVEYVTDVHIFPEDKFAELKDKIYVSIGIPVYRQHILYFDSGLARTTYQTFVDGAADIDIRSLGTSSPDLHGVPVDRTMYDNRKSLRVEAADSFVLLEAVNLTDNTIYVVDLDQFTSRVRTQLAEMLKDTYQTELYYNGFVLKYWPQLTEECFREYVRAEANLRNRYPELAKDKRTLASHYSSERDVIVRKYRHTTKSNKMINSADVTFAITHLTATTSGSQTTINIRNLFDMLRTSPQVPEIRAYVTRKSGDYILRKYHHKLASAPPFPASAYMKIGVTIVVSLRRADQLSNHARSTTTVSFNEQSRYAYLNVRADGRYYIKTMWDEEDELSISDIFKTIKHFFDPLINGINTLGKRVFASGNLAPIDRSTIAYQNISMCTCWKKVILPAAFKQLREKWEEYVRASIVSHRPNQQPDKIELTFRKGMHEFDTSLIDKTLNVSSNLKLTNQYAHLSSAVVKLKWDQNYDGRVLRMYHRITDVKFEMPDVRERELEIAFDFLIDFIYNASLDANIGITTQPSKLGVKKLRKLKEQDPELYNLKKHGSTRVYSILCQNQRQPLIYTKDEVAALKPAELNKLTEYWNFTLNRPAYYGCPNKKYPHLGFVIGYHPKSYCLPCCNMEPATGENSKKRRVTSTCLKDKKYFGDESAVEGVARHVTNYGRAIDNGRLSRLPNSPIRGILNETANDNLSYCLFGVTQHAPGLNNVGIFYAIAAILNIGQLDVATAFSEYVRSSNVVFQTIAGGSLFDYFASSEVAADEVINVFSGRVSLQTSYNKWPELLIELALAVYGLLVIVFVDEKGDGTAIRLYAPAASVSLLRGSDGTRVGIVFRQVNRYYPLFLVDADNFFKTLSPHAREYTRESKLGKLLVRMVNHAYTKSLTNSTVDLAAMLTFSQGRGYKIEKKFVNRQNLAYGISVRVKAKLMYLPIAYSSDSKIPPVFTPPSREELPTPSDVLAVIEEINESLSNEYKQIRLTKAVINSAGEVVCLLSDGLAFHTAPVAVSGLTIPTRVASCDYLALNRDILDRAKPKEDETTSKLGIALYTNFLYHLFVIGFISHLNEERNKSVREKIVTAIRKTDFKRGIGSLKSSLKSILADFPLDYTEVMSRVGEYYYGHSDVDRLLEQLESSVFSFDKITINKLKSLQRDELKREILRLASEFTVQKDVTSVRFPNVFLPCSTLGIDTGYCEGKKLIVNVPVEYLADLLATDLLDELKSRYILGELWLEGVTDYFNFRRSATDKLVIYKTSN